MKFRRKRYLRPPLVHGNQTSKQIMMSHFDPNGSYTGVPVAPDEERRPIQDVDDL